MASKPGSNSPSTNQPASNPGSSNAVVYNNTLSGVSERPGIPRLHHDRIHKTRPTPRSLQDYRAVEGVEQREERLKALWHRLPKKKIRTDAGIYNQEEEAIVRETVDSLLSEGKHQELTRAHAETLRDMYEDELRDRYRVVDWDTFLAYADQKEVELWSIFHEQLDLDGNGHLDAVELHDALSKAGIEMTSSKLSDFMSFLASSPHSQAISFTEFRDFLLLMPRTVSTKEIYRYYEVRKFLGDDGHGVARVNMEGDVSLSAEDRHPRHKGHAHGIHHLPTLDDEQPHEQAGDDHDGYLYDDDDEEELEEEDPHASFFVMVGHSQAFKFLFAGGIAGAVSRTATAPFDRLKVFLITHQIEPTHASGTSASNAAKQTAHGMKVLLQAVGRLYAEGGLRAFWVGNGLNVVKIFPESAIKFLSYEYAKRIFAKHWDKVDDPRQISGTSRFLSGGIGGIASQFSIYPLETLKTQMMSSSGERRDTLITCVKRTWALGGVRAYYRGLTIGLIGVFPYSAIDMSTFEALKLAYSRSTGNQEPGVLALLAFGSISGTVGATSVYPLNLIRTRLQASGSPGHPKRYAGMADVISITMEKEGWRGFYRGLVPTLAKVIPAVSISYVVYETSKRKLGV